MLRGRNLTIFSLSCKRDGEELTTFRKSKIVQSSKLFTGIGIGLIDSKALPGTVCLNHSILQVFSGLMKLIALELPLMLLLTLWSFTSKRVYLLLPFSTIHLILFAKGSLTLNTLFQSRRTTIFLHIKQVHSFSDNFLLF